MATQTETVFEYPPISAVISTRNRGDSVVEAVVSILANDYPEFELIVVDQSDTDLTRIALQPLLENPHLTYITTTEVGASKGRNRGIQMSRYELIALTDDDCVVPVNWLEKMAQALTYNPQIGLVFGNVIAGEYDATKGFVPVFVCSQPEMIVGTNQKNRTRGIGACMGLTKTTWQQVYGFDPALGPGSLFKCSEDFDFAHKVLANGQYIYQTPELHLIHNGFRTFAQGRGLAHRNYYGIGAYISKHLKCREWLILKVAWYEMMVLVIGGIWSRLLKTGRISGVMPLLAFSQGFAKGLLTPVDQHSRNFAPKSSSFSRRSLATNPTQTAAK